MNEVITIRDLSSRIGTTFARHVPGTPHLGGDPDLESEELAAKYDLTDISRLASILMSGTFDSFSEKQSTLHQTPLTKISGDDMFACVVDIFVAVHQLLVIEASVFPGALQHILLDLFGPFEAKRVSAIFKFLGGDIPLRDAPLPIEDPFVLDIIIDPLVTYFRASKPDASYEEVKIFLEDALLERWPATEPSLAKAAQRAWERQTLSYSN